MELLQTRYDQAQVPSCHCILLHCVTHTLTRMHYTVLLLCRMICTLLALTKLDMKRERHNGKKVRTTEGVSLVVPNRSLEFIT